MSCSPTGLDGWNADVSRPLASSAAIAEQRFGRELEHAVANDGDLDGAELEAVEAGLRPVDGSGRTSQGGDGGGKRSSPDGGRAGTEERSAVKLEHVCSPLRVELHMMIVIPSSARNSIWIAV